MEQRLVRRLGVAILIASMAPTGHLPTDAAPTKPVQPCREFVASPDFVKDRTAFCAGEVIDSRTAQATGVEVYATRDGGRSWAKAAALGLVTPPAPQGFMLRELFISPRFAADHTVFVQLEFGLFSSADHGETFVSTGAVTGGRLTPFVAAPVAPAAEPRTVLAHAQPGSAEGSNNSGLLDPTTRTVTPVRGTPGRDVEFAISPDFARDGLAYAVAERGVGLDYRFELFRCDTTFNCSVPFHRFPNRWTFDRIWLAPDFSTSRTIYASVYSLDSGITVWWSRNGGPFKRWTAVEKLLVAGHSDVFGLSGLLGSRQLYLRVAGGDPNEQLFLSRDGGATWSRISYGRTPAQPGPRGSMPYSRISPFDVPRGMVTAVGGGRIFMLGDTYDVNTGTHTQSFYCTVDHGRSWLRQCSR